jgi:RNA polymerase sigma factor for flagellar operon FliA
MSTLDIRLARSAATRRVVNAPQGEVCIEGMTREEVIAKYASKVTYIARRIMHRLPSHASIELDDLINTGALGLMDALEKFDPAKKIRFGTYAEFRIRGAILDLLRGADLVSRGVREKSNQLQKTMRTLEARLGRPASSPEIAAELGLNTEEYHRLLNQVRSVNLVSLDAGRNADDDGSGTLADVIEDVQAERPDLALERKEANAAMADAIQNHLPERLRHVLVMYYYREMNLKEIGAVLGVSESRVSQLHTEACMRLRSRLHAALRPGENIDLNRRAVSR